MYLNLKDIESICEKHFRILQLFQRLKPGHYRKRKLIYNKPLLAMLLLHFYGLKLLERYDMNGCLNASLWVVANSSSSDKLSDHLHFNFNHGRRLRQTSAAENGVSIFIDVWKLFNSCLPNLGDLGIC